MSVSSFLNEIASKWQKTWEENKVYEADPKEGRPKRLITVAFPYTNSPLHIGHGRTYITGDIYARYLRMKGYNVLFPFAFQYTGTPILSIAEAVKKKDEDIVSTFVKVYGIPEEEVEKFSDPQYLAEYFMKDMENTAKTLGLSVDWRRKFTTVDPYFEKFVQWQYKRLMELGFLKKEKSAVPYCPNDQFPVGMHDTRGDIEPEVIDVDVIYFASDSGLFFPAATSRLETVFGAVALLINPSSEYLIVNDKKSGKRLVLSRYAYQKLKYQMDLEEEKSITVDELVNYKVKNPLTNKDMKVVKSKYVEPKQGTGIVMAVPAHEPIHYLALTELGESFEIIPVISSDEYGDIPASEVLAIAQTTNAQELKDYIDALYRIEYHKGVIREDVLDHVPSFIRDTIKERVVNKSVREARKALIDILKNLDAHFTIYEISNGPVYCRCGAEIVVKVINEQWFINYSNSIWKASTLKALDKIKFVPDDAKREMEKVVFNLQPRAFTRSRGLGVRLPWDSKEIIDSLSDSTIYTAFYTIAHKVKKIDLNKVDDKFWDYVMLGRGEQNDLPVEVAELRKEFLYWYPVDSRHSGRDLIQNHLAYYIYHHVAVFGENMLPKQIVTNGFIRVGGKKMSKSFGNIYPLARAINEYGVDTVRLALTSTSSIGDDIEFNSSIAKSIGDQLKHIHDYIIMLLKAPSTQEIRKADLWLSSIVSNYVKKIDEAMEKLDFRSAYVNVFYTMYEVIKDYVELTNSVINKDVVGSVLSVWIRMMAPFTPHIAEEIWHYFNDSFVVTQKFPEPTELKVDGGALLEIEYLRLFVDKINELSANMSKEPEKLIVYVNSDPELKKVLRKAIRAIEERQTLKDFMLDVGDDATAKRLYEVASELPSLVRELYTHNDLDEEKVLVSNLRFIMNKLNLTEIVIYDAKDTLSPDIKGKKSLALPLSPGIVLI
ncbi:leucine--tRNA ligase [Stygiolobus caldivivus]|uniref:Leucine--tRNA ligase n=1 Tax=Stygiolobus caldivivus TaxID=2824673 RepID=A0A8D5U790_9CREN|nr:leucine--tRNA ligase [Stygiolobus caldivivus]BCU70282.1 leucine--tRNA ligase [Stygiolobus caldivivus]